MSKTAVKQLRGKGERLVPIYKRRIVNNPESLTLQNLSKDKTLRKFLNLADKELNNREKQYILKRVLEVINYKIDGISTSSKVNDKMFVTLDVDAIYKNSWQSYGGTQSERIGILTASELLHEASHRDDTTEETGVKLVKKILERKKPTLFVKLLREVNERREEDWHKFITGVRGVEYV